MSFFVEMGRSADGTVCYKRFLPQIGYIKHDMIDLRAVYRTRFSRFTIFMSQKKFGTEFAADCC